MIRMILTLLFVVLFLILSIPVFFVEWILSKFNKRAADFSSLRIVQWAFRCVAFFSGIRLTVIGEENVPKDEPVLYVGNHRSFFDIVVTYARCPGLTGYVSKESVFKIPLLSTWMKRLYCIPLNRSNNREALKSILLGIEQIKQGISICIFPEGTRNLHPQELMPFKEGSLKMAEKTGCAIVPFALNNTEAIFESHFPWVKSAHVILEYGKPIYPKELDAETKKALGSHTRELIQEMVTKNESLVS